MCITSILVEILRSTSQLLLIFSLLIALRFVDVPASWSNFISHGWFLAFAVLAGDVERLRHTTVAA
nr:mechanosensitive ion channel protein MscS [Candidatus Pantoea persica]